MIETIKHHIGENFTLILDIPEQFYLTIRSVADGKVFNFENKTFEPFNSVIPYTAPHIETSSPFATLPILQSIKLDFLPRKSQDLLFEIRSVLNNNLLKIERHVYGGYSDPALKKCTIFGTLIDPSGRPIIGAKVEVFLNKTGYFIDKVPLMGPSITSLSNETGYFELDLLQGMDVTISVPAIALTTRGYVPLTTSLELSPYCLLAVPR